MRSTRGFSLFEVMIACLVISLGLSGIALLSLTGVLLTDRSSDHTQAVMLAAELVEIAALSPGHQAELEQALSSDIPECLDGSACVPNAFLANNLAQWKARLEKQLPEANGIFCEDSSPGDRTAGDPTCDSSGPAHIRLTWGDGNRFELEHSP